MVKKLEGSVEQVLAKGLYRVRCDDGSTVTASLGSWAGVVVKVLPGDRVALEVSPFDVSRGRIKARCK